jgi:hypothetical protein
MHFFFELYAGAYIRMHMYDVPHMLMDKKDINHLLYKTEDYYFLIICY